MIIFLFTIETIFIMYSPEIAAIKTSIFLILGNLKMFFSFFFYEYKILKHAHAIFNTVSCIQRF